MALSDKSTPVNSAHIRLKEIVSCPKCHCKCKIVLADKSPSNSNSILFNEFFQVVKFRFQMCIYSVIPRLSVNFYLIILFFHSSRLYFKITPYAPLKDMVFNIL